MTSTTNASTILADSLAQFSKAANAFAEIENQSRLEVLRAVSETREAREETRKARNECDKISRDLHAATLEAQGWKQAAADAKATLGQAELTIAHQAENLESQHQTIAELQREVSQWKDQSRNWQEHFLRVEGDRCAQSSRIEELLKLQLNHPINKALFSPNASATHPHTSAITTSSSQQDPQTPVGSRSTLIRRVKAVVHVKHEESDDDSAEDFSATANIVKDDAFDGNENVGANRRRFTRRSRKNDIGQHHLIADGNPVLESRHLRHRNAGVNREDDDDDDDDELMMGAEENHDEVYGTQPVETLDSQRLKQQHPVTAPPLKKKRKVVGAR